MTLRETGPSHLTKQHGIGGGSCVPKPYSSSLNVNNDGSLVQLPSVLLCQSQCPRAFVPSWFTE